MRYIGELNNMERVRQIYKGKLMKQRDGVIKKFDSFFEEEKFKNIVEIGTGWGIFSIYLASKAKEMGATFTTYDIKKVRGEVRNKLLKLNANIIVGDINKNKDVEDIVKREGRFLLLNDGGLKVPQFHRFSKLIKINDIILTHDYYRDRNPGKGIVVIEDIKKSIKENNLKIINVHMIDEHMWLCVIKREL